MSCLSHRKSRVKSLEAYEVTLDSFFSHHEILRIFAQEKNDWKLKLIFYSEHLRYVLVTHVFLMLKIHNHQQPSAD